MLVSVGVFAFTSFSTTCPSKPKAYLYLCITVWGPSSTYSRLIFDHSSDIVHVEFRQDSWIGDGTRTSVCLWFSFLSVSFLFGVLMSARLPHDPDVVSCPQSVNSASLLVEQSSYRSLQQNISVCQICSYNTKQHWLRNSPDRRRESLLLLHTLASFLIFFLLSLLLFIMLLFSIIVLRLLSFMW